MAAEKRRWRYLVRGTHPFPVDMLRYDRATPEHERDSGRIVASFERSWRRTAAPIALIGYNEPTPERWASFGWAVVSDVERVQAA